MDDQLFQLLLVSIGGDKLTIVGLLLLLAWSAGLLGGSGAGRVIPIPVPIPPIPPKPTDPPTPPTPPQPPLQSARGSWYSQYQGKYSWVDTGDKPGSNALGVPDDDQGVSFYNRSTLGQWFEVHAPNGVVSIEQQTDIGPNPSTGRGIDISAACAERIGYSPKNFPTDGTFQWRSVPAPEAVALLSPPAQAIAYQKVRGASAPGQPQAPSTVVTPPWVTLGRTFNGLVWSDGPMPAQLQTWMDNIATTFPEMAPYCKAMKAAGVSHWWAWCGFFVQAMLAYSNIRGPISSAGLSGQTTTADWAYVDSWKTWGTKVWDASDGDISDANPQPGDVLIWYVPKVIHHVSFYNEPEPDTNDFASLGGDQGKPLRVCIEDISMNYCVAIRRPPSA